MKNLVPTLCAGVVKTSAVSLMLVAAAQAQTNDQQDLYQILEAQQARIEALEQGGNAGGAASGSGKTTIGGYGELHYNNLNGRESEGDLEEIDFHRFVMFFGHEFNDRLRFFSEVELEHSLAGDDQPGGVELEQAYIEYDVNQNVTARGGVMLLPVGIINETHEPPTFYGVERNNVESVIIPATWLAGGAGFSLKLPNAGLSWDTMVHEGLAVPTSGDNAFRIRSGRQKTAEASASDLAVTTRVKYTGVPGLEVAASLQYQDDISQVQGDGLDRGLLFTTHAVLNRGRYGLRALYAIWDLSGAAVEAADDDRQTGWYIEPSYKISNQWGVFARYEDVEGAGDSDEFTEKVVGVNYWPHPNVVLKADIRARDHDLDSREASDFDGFDLGVGYQF